MSSMIIPIGFGGAGASGGGSFIIVSGVTVADIGGKTVVVSLAGEELYNATVPNNIQSVSFTITEAGVYTITVGGTAYSVNVSTLSANYMLTVGDTSTSRPPTVFKTAGTHSYTVPSGVKKLYITGAGGGGGGNYYAGGGGGDACFNKIITVTPDTTYTITVGSGGSGTTSQTGNGSSGTASKFGSLLTLAGGGGAQYTGSAPTSMQEAVPCVGAPGGIGGGGYYPTVDKTVTVPYGSGRRLERIRRMTDVNNNEAATTTFPGYFGSNAVVGGLCGENMLYSVYYPHGSGSLGVGARGIMGNNNIGGCHISSYGGGGCAKASISGSTWTPQSYITTAYQKGAAGCIIVSEEPLEWAEMWGLLGEKFYSVPYQYADGSGYLII